MANQNTNIIDVTDEFDKHFKALESHYKQLLQLNGGNIVETWQSIHALLTQDLPVDNNKRLLGRALQDIGSHYINAVNVVSPSSQNIPTHTEPNPFNKNTVVFPITPSKQSYQSRSPTTLRHSMTPGSTKRTMDESMAPVQTPTARAASRAAPSVPGASSPSALLSGLRDLLPQSVHDLTAVKKEGDGSPSKKSRYQ